MYKLSGNDKYQYYIDSCLPGNSFWLKLKHKNEKATFSQRWLPVLIEVTDLVSAFFYYIFFWFF